MHKLTIPNNITRIDCDSLNKYFKEISKEHLLTSEEEVEVVRQIKQGDPNAKDRLVKANLRFVVSIAKQYQKGPVPLSDLINEGNIGLIKAAERFDETRGFKFITYAVWWIRQSILAALEEQSRIIRVPSNKISLFSKTQKVIDEWVKNNGRMPTHFELAEIMDINEDDIHDIINLFHSTSSLDTLMDEKGDYSFIVMISEDDNQRDYQRSNDAEDLKNDVNKILSRLGKREKEIVEMVFGINRSSALSLEEISSLLGISRERVRQIKEKALKKLSFHTVRKRIRKLTAAG